MRILMALALAVFCAACDCDSPCPTYEKGEDITGKVVWLWNGGAEDLVNQDQRERDVYIPFGPFISADGTPMPESDNATGWAWHLGFRGAVPAESDIIRVQLPTTTSPPCAYTQSDRIVMGDIVTGSWSGSITWEPGDYTLTFTVKDDHKFVAEDGTECPLYEDEPLVLKIKVHLFDIEDLSLMGPVDGTRGDSQTFTCQGTPTGFPDGTTFDYIWNSIDPISRTTIAFEVMADRGSSSTWEGEMVMDSLILCGVQARFPSMSPPIPRYNGASFFYAPENSINFVANPRDWITPPTPLKEDVGSATPDMDDIGVFDSAFYFNCNDIRMARIRHSTIPKLPNLCLSPFNGSSSQPLYQGYRSGITPQFIDAGPNRQHWFVSEASFRLDMESRLNPYTKPAYAPPPELLPPGSPNWYNGYQMAGCFMNTSSGIRNVDVALILEVTKQHENMGNHQASDLGASGHYGRILETMVGHDPCRRVESFTSGLSESDLRQQVHDAVTTINSALFMGGDAGHQYVKLNWSKAVGFDPNAADYDPTTILLINRVLYLNFMWSCDLSCNLSATF